MASFKTSSSPLKRLVSGVILFILGSSGLYILLFGLATKRHTSNIDRIEKKARAIFIQLSEKKKALEMIPPESVFRQSESLSFFKPGPVFCVFFCKPGSDAEALEALKDFLVSVKQHLSGLNLSGVDLSGRKTDLSQAKLDGSKLKKARLVGTNLSKALLRGADLREARLSGANLRGADLSQADLSGADLRGVSLVGADLRASNLFYADFLGADLRDAKLSGVKMSAADFRDVNLLNVDLSGAILGGARLDGANMKGARLFEADLRYADLSKTTGLTQEILGRVIVDKNTRLPEGLVAPEVMPMQDSH